MLILTFPLALCSRKLFSDSRDWTRCFLDHTKNRLLRQVASPCAYVDRTGGPTIDFNAGGERGSPYVAAFKWSAVKLGTHGNTLPIQVKWGIYKNFSVFLASSQPITIPDLQTLNMISIVQLWYSRPRRKSIMTSWRRNAEKDVMRAPPKSFTI